MPPPFKVKAIYDYSSPHDDDLNFSNGQIITVTDEEDEDWFTGHYADAAGANQEGLFPRNFVEKYEPEIPSRPTRSGKPKKEAEPVIAEPQENVKTASAPVQENERVKEFESPGAAQPISSPPPSTVPPAEQQAPSNSEQVQPVQASPDPAQKLTAAKPPPPQVAAKPASGSFKDRIAAFNKPAAPPITPYKPNAQGGGSSGFIKKPFVAPPPSKNAYIPPTREPPPQKIYRREEEPAVPESEPQKAQESAEPAPEEEPSKPTSLKDRIALLQKQQLEQAARHSEVAQKKEKSKRPPKKRLDSQEQASQLDETVASRPSDAAEPVGKKSVDSTEEEAGPLQSHSDRHAIPSISMATPPQPSRELTSDTNDADYSAADDTEDAEETSASREDAAQSRARLPSSSGKPPPSTNETLPPRMKEMTAEASENGGTDEEEEDQEEDVDPELKRRMEIRERMAKMSGGMGMMGMFGPPGGMPAAGSTKKSKSSGDRQKAASGSNEESSQAAQAPPVPILALPGMSKMKSPEQAPVEAEPEAYNDTEQTPIGLPIPKYRPTEAVQDVEEVEPAQPRQASQGGLMRPQDRVPPPPPRETRPPPPLTPEGLLSQPSSPPASRGGPEISRAAAPLSAGEDSDDELSRGGSRLSLDQMVSGRQLSLKKDAAAAPRPPQASPFIPSAPPRTSTDLSSHDLSPTTQTQPAQKRASRPPPPVPVSSTPETSPVQSRPPPPPPPPGQPPSRKSTSDSRTAPAFSKHQVDNDSEEEVTEYDGDYDTDIASGAKHKDALKAHDGDSSYDEGTITDEATNRSPTGPPVRGPPPLPPSAAPRAMPPPPPGQPPKPTRKSSDMPRAPPPIPPSREQDEDEYDPFRYTKGGPPPPPPNSRPPIVQSPSQEVDEDEMYGGSPISSPPAMPPSLSSERNLPPPPPPPTHPSQPPPVTGNMPRQSLDVNRSKTTSRRSMEQPRSSVDTGFIASDVDLAEKSYWWTQENLPPPTLQNRKDILYEMETSQSTKGNQPAIARDIYIIYMDYSQTTVTATFDQTNPSDVSLEQKHQRPPPPLRQDQLENASVKYGSRISEAVTAAQNTVVGDGTPHSLVLELLRPLFSEALMPVGIRSYGALVYANLANASTQQFDEIRAGDIVTFRNAKFQGHRGTMHQKYSAEAGKPDHVGIVLDWDGTKKKIRAWEQGRESKKVKVESFKVGDLRSGECRVWRVMGRDWVGWDAK